MIKDKISSQEIIDLVATKASVSKRAAEEFLKVMISSIEDALYAGDSVKIKNFGTFKMQWNEARKSVNIHSGEEILLPGFHKVTFTPDVILRDLVNEPFAHLEPVELDGDDSIDLQKEEQGDVALDPLRIFTEQASEIKNILSEIQALSPSKSAVDTKEEISVGDVVVEKKAKVEIPDYVFEDEVIEIKEPVVEIIGKAVEFESAQVQENQAKTIESITEVVSPVNEVAHVASETTSEFESTPFLSTVKTKSVRKYNGWFAIPVIALVAIGLYVVLYFNVLTVRDFTNRLFDGLSAWTSPKPKPAPKPEVLIVAKDTTEIDSIDASEEEMPVKSVDSVKVVKPVKAVKPVSKVDSLQLLFDNPRVYDEYIATEQIKQSSRLTLISQKYYGTKDFWVYIYEANKERIADPDNITAGTLIRIPKLDPRLIDAANPRCMKKARELHDKYVKR